MKENKTKKTGQVNAIGLIGLFTEQMNGKREKGNLHTASNYSSCINKLYVYLGEQACSFPMQEVTPAWVQGWVNHLTALHPDHPETVDFYLRNTRAMYNLVALSQKKRPDPTTHPFHGIRVKMLQPSKRALSKNEVKKLLVPEFRESLKPLLRETFDVLQFIFFANGIVFQDIYNLRWDMVDERGRIRFLRSKTGGYVEISVTPEAREIMDRYRRSDSAFVFPFLRSSKKSSLKRISEPNALRRVNLHASAIGKSARLSLPLTTYVMRHTWATLMLESGKAVELISQCMGHSNIQTTQIYLSRISSAKVETEVNDMLNQVRRKPTAVALKKEKKPEITSQKVEETDRAEREEKAKFETDKQLLARINTLTKSIKKDFPFLYKKEKILLFSF